MIQINFTTQFLQYIWCYFNIFIFKNNHNKNNFFLFSHLNWSKTVGMWPMKARDVSLFVTKVLHSGIVLKPKLWYRANPNHAALHTTNF